MVGNDQVTKDNISQEELLAPCMAACPVLTDARKYISLIARQRYDEALRYVMEYNPFPASIGRVCVHPCETACRRGQVDESISICALKRFVDDQVGGEYKPEKPRATKDKSVAVIGSGPSGLTAAYDLVHLGYKVSVFEKNKKAGGMLRYGILDYRLPQEDLDKDINNILDVGIEIKTGVEIGSDVYLTDIQKEFDSVLIAVGLSISRGLPLPGADLEGVHYALPFLEAANTQVYEKIGEDIIVIGGGNVAVDVARTARRQGSPKVKMVCLESRDEMPAHNWEIDDALQEGVEIHCSFGPHNIIGIDGKVGGLEFKEVECVFDEEGRFNPKFHPTNKTEITGDSVIFAIGQGSELGFLKNSEVKINDRGQLELDRSSMQTSVPSVFATGEVAYGPGAAIQAIASGHRAARSIDHFLETGESLKLDESQKVGLGELPGKTRELIGSSKRQVMPTVDVDQRLKDFREVDEGFSVDAAVREAQRCLSCGAGATVDKGKCIACLTCVRICPYEVPKIVGAFAEIDPVECQSCGICGVECPAEAIEVQLTKEHLFDDRLSEIEARFKEINNETKAVGFVCQYGQMWANERLWQIDDKLPNSVEIIDTLCLGRISVNMILGAYKAGADRVYLMPCNTGKCRNKTGNKLAMQKAGLISELLSAIGYGEEVLQVKPIDFGVSLIAALGSEE